MKDTLLLIFGICLMTFIIIFFVYSDKKNRIDDILSKGAVETEQGIIFQHPMLGLYWHGGNRYTIKYLDDNNEVNNIYIGRDHFFKKANIFLDVDNIGDEWYKCINDGKKSVCEFHLKSIDDIRTSGWDHGKFGSGSTVKIH